MKIKLIDFGLKADHHPFRPHENDAGADVFMPYDCTLEPGEISRIPLGFGLVIPDGFAGYVFPRSSMCFLSSTFPRKKRWNSLLSSRDFPCFQRALCIPAHKGMLHSVAFPFEDQ